MYAMNLAGSLAFALMLLCGIFLLWLLIREINCWYFKINERVRLQRRTNELLEKVIETLDPPIMLTEKVEDDGPENN